MHLCARLKQSAGSHTLCLSTGTGGMQVKRNQVGSAASRNPASDNVPHKAISSSSIRFIFLFRCSPPNNGRIRLQTPRTIFTTHQKLSNTHNARLTEFPGFQTFDAKEHLSVVSTQNEYVLCAYVVCVHTHTHTTPLNLRTILPPLEHLA